MYQNYDEEHLVHYGVPGMKWGVRKDVRLLANSKRNRKIKRIKEDYKKGLMTKDEKRMSISKANRDKKKYINDTENRYRKAKSYSEIYKLDDEISAKAFTEVKNKSAKKNASMIADTVTKFAVADAVAGAAIVSSVMPTVAPIVITSAALSSSIYIGANKLAQMGLDKLS